MLKRGALPNPVKSGNAVGARKGPSLEGFIESGDFVGAATLLEFELRAAESTTNAAKTLAWLGWASFHGGDFKRSLEAFELLEARPPAELEVLEGPFGKGAVGAGVRASSRAAALFYCGEHSKAATAAFSAPDCGLKWRVAVHSALRAGDEAALSAAHARLDPASRTDALALAAMAFVRGHYADAAEAYKKLLADDVEKQDIAIYAFVALCLYKLDHYELSLEALQVYLQVHPSSLFAINLKACNHFKLYNGKAAEAEIKVRKGWGVKRAKRVRASLNFFQVVRALHSTTLRGAYCPPPPPQTLADHGYALDADTHLKHNSVVFRGGDCALSVLPGLVNLLPEARLNLAIFHLRAGRVADAAVQLADVEPTTVSEYILKATVLAALGQAALLGSRAGVVGGGAGGGSNGSSAAAAATALLAGLSPRDALKRATAFFHLVGASPSECDTIPGRQAMSLCFFLKRQFEDVVVYLSSIKQYLYAEDEFNWNYGIALAAVGNYEDAEKALLLVGSPVLTADASYVAWLARCYCMNGRARAAWDLYLTRSESSSGAAALQLLRVIATDAYTVGAFLYAAKAFDVLEKLDPAAADGDAWAGKAGACAGVLQAVVAGAESKDALREVHAMVRASAAAALPGSHVHKQADALLRAMQAWAARQK